MAKHLLANPFVRMAGQLMFTWSLVGVALEALTSYGKIKQGDKGLHVYRTLTQHIAGDNSGLSLARRKDATCFLRWIMSVIPDPSIQACYQSAVGGKAFEKRFWSVILKVYQSTRIEKEDGSRQSLENHSKLDDIGRLSNKNFEESHGVHRDLVLAEDYSRPTKRGKNQYVSCVMCISYNRFLDAEAGAA